MKILKNIFYLLILAWLIYTYGLPFYKTYNAAKEETDLYNSLASDGLPWKNSGHSELGNIIYSIELGESEKPTLLLAGFHGNRHGGSDLAVRLAKYLYANPDVLQKKVIIIPVINPDGLLAGEAVNNNGVNIERNFPAKDWSPVYEDKEHFPGNEAASEMETRALLKIIYESDPEKIIAISDDGPAVSWFGPAKALANEIIRNNGYEISTEKNYKLSGSFFVFCGIDLDIPTILLSLPIYAPQNSWLKNKEALTRAINF